MPLTLKARSARQPQAAECTHQGAAYRDACRCGFLCDGCVCDGSSVLAGCLRVPLFLCAVCVCVCILRATTSARRYEVENGRAARREKGETEPFSSLPLSFLSTSRPSSSSRETSEKEPEKKTAHTECCAVQAGTVARSTTGTRAREEVGCFEVPRTLCRQPHRSALPRATPFGGLHLCRGLRCRPALPPTAAGAAAAQRGGRHRRRRGG